MAMPTNSALQEQINRALLRIIAGDEWDKLVVHYMGIRS
jgi:ABC-type amino acid transport substrate-binding protein